MDRGAPCRIARHGFLPPAVGDGLGAHLTEEEKRQHDIEDAEGVRERRGAVEPRRIDGEADGGNNDGEDDDVLEERLLHEPATA